jgi:hypothetical protein
VTVVRCDRILTEQLENLMRKSFLAVATVCLFAMPAAAGELRGAQSTEFSSQGVYIEGPGVGMRVGPDRRDRWRERRWREREVRRGGGDGCRSVTVRETRPDGSVVTRTRSRC